MGGFRHNSIYLHAVYPIIPIYGMQSVEKWTDLLKMHVEFWTTVGEIPVRINEEYPRPLFLVTLYAAGAKMFRLKFHVGIVLFCPFMLATLKSSAFDEMGTSHSSIL